MTTQTQQQPTGPAPTTARPVPRVTVRVYRAAEGAWYRLDPDTGTETREETS